MGNEGTHIDSTLSLISATVGMEAFSLTSALSKSFGIVTFARASREGMLNCGASMSANGFTSLIASTADWIVLFTEDTSFWMLVRRPEFESVFSMKSVV